ncbi:hypothetical protein BJF78_16230 [Pseudonocardia sp. CNS-139]|nr:hypothetical protein BJF78_16230 [Pseudonocardia sp. CNS-139]
MCPIPQPCSARCPPRRRGRSGPWSRTDRRRGARSAGPRSSRSRRTPAGRPRWTGAVAALPESVGWVALADPDVRWRPGALDALLAAAARLPRAGMLGPRLVGPAGDLPSGGTAPTAFDAVRGRVPAGVPAAGPGGLALDGGRAAAAGRVGLRGRARPAVPRRPGRRRRRRPRRTARARGLARRARAGGAGRRRCGDRARHPGAAHGRLRRYLHDRGRAPARALLALAGAVRPG